MSFSRRFTRSADGVDRMSVHLTIRVTHQGIADIQRLAAQAGQAWHVWVSQTAAAAINSALAAAREDTEGK